MLFRSALKKLKIGEGSGGDGGSEAPSRRAVAGDGGSGTRGAISSGGAGGSHGGGSDDAVGEADGVDLGVHAASVQDLVVPPLHVEEEVSFPFSPLYFSVFSSD